MGALGAVFGIFHYAGLFVQLNAALSEADVKLDSPESGSALFTEVPHNIKSQPGEDVEMACSFRGAGSPLFSLEIQWWYIKKKNWQEAPAHITTNVGLLEETPKEATKISVVKVAGSNISHRLRLSSVKAADEGTYECHVIDHSGPTSQRYRVQAYLQVEPARSQEVFRDRM